MANRKTTPMMEWRLQSIMGERKIRTATELHRKLANLNISVSSAQLSRLMNTNPRRVSSDVMYGLTRILECDASDLWRNPDHGKAAPEASISTQRTSKKKRKANQGDDTSKITGPKIQVFPVKGT